MSDRALAAASRPSQSENGERSDGVVIGAGWLGTAIASAHDLRLAPRRSFAADQIIDGSVVFVASGRSSVSADMRLADVLREELGHLRTVLDACEGANARRVVVLGSSDVAGLAERVGGGTPQAPVTTYAHMKAALEDECVMRAADGLPVTVVRLAPVHGAGKERSASLVRLARGSIVPLPAGGRHSIGFALLGDALSAIQWLSENPAPAVVAVGGGPTPLRQLLQHLAEAQGRDFRFVPVPMPTAALRRVAPLHLPDSIHWLLRLSLPRSVEMEVPVPVTPLAEAAAMLVASC